MIQLLNIVPTITLFQSLQIAIAALVWAFAHIAAVKLWDKWVSPERHERLSQAKRYLCPLLSYVLFILGFSVLAVLAYALARDITLFGIITQLSLFLLIGQYLKILTGSYLISGATFLLLSGGWFLKSQLFASTFTYLNDFSFQIGQVSITPWALLKLLFIIVGILWITSLVSTQSKKSLYSIPQMKSGTKIMIGKMLDIGLYVLAFILVLNVVGINLSSLTVIGGALSVGIGFGLQKITSNFVSGLILIFEKSIKINDLIEIEGGVYGFVRHLGSRYTLIETLDRKEVLVPNEDFVTNRVTNWTYSNKSGRLELKIGVSYKSDIKLAKALILEAAGEHPKSLKHPEPQCYLTQFGDSSVDFLLYFYVKDVTHDRFDTPSEILLSVWDKFKENNIEIPFPQRDVHIIQES